jgi:ATP-binding cassette subfamily B protein/subfamily B ATP-binding cassette protein MsbA
MPMSLFLDRLLGPLVSQKPAFRLIRQTAREQWRLIALNLGSNLLGAFSEGATLGVVFLAIQVLSSQGKEVFNWSKVPILGSIPTLAGWLNTLPATTLFLSLLALAVLLQALQSITRYLNQVSIGYFAARCRSLVTALIHSQIMKLTFSCASNYKVGDFTDFANQGPIAIRTQIEETSTLMVGVLLCFTYLAVLIRISPLLLLAVILIVLAITLIQKELLPRIRAGSRVISHYEVEINTRITENFQGLRLLHTSGQLEMADAKLRKSMGELEHRLRGQVEKMAIVAPLSSLLPIIAIVLICALSLLLLRGSSNGILPSLVTFVLGLQKLGGRINIITANLNQLANNKGRFDRLNQILSTQDKQFRQIGGFPFSTLAQSIQFKKVSLFYSDSPPPALEDICFTLPKGKMLALVGASGSGKSSIADLITGLYKPTTGTILIDNIPLTDLDISSWQNRLGVVSQDTFLFNASISENIAFGTPGATKDRIKAACASAQAAGFIEELPDSYDTMVGERGYRLSGGQRQRLSLARAILRDPELLILDEATSALDSRSEQLVQQAIDRFERDHTVLVIAHRLSTIVKADQILVLDKGKVIEDGNHDSLIAAKGTYYNMWASQSLGSQLNID